MPLPYPPSEIKQRLQRDLAGVLRRLALDNDGGGKGGVWLPRNPRRNDRSPGSFVIWTEGDAAGAFKDFALGETAKGDVFGLIEYVAKLAEWIDAYWWALQHLNLPRGGDGRAPRGKADDRLEAERIAAEKLAREAKRVGEDAAKGRSLKGAWIGMAEGPGSPVETYLRQARGIPLARLAKWPDAVKYCRAAEWIDPVTGEVYAWANAMAGLFVRESTATGLHLTFLAAGGAGKARMARPKLMFGRVRGAAIRLSRGASKLSPSAAAKAGRLGPLAIGEGIETCLTVAAAWPDYRVWAAGSLGNIGAIDWPDCASSVVLLAENDQSPEALAAFDRVRAAWRHKARGRPVHIAQPAAGAGDFNDLVREGG